MILNFRMPVAGALLAAIPLGPLPLGQALAADYDPPIYIEELPEYVPVEVGSAWYLRGDISYNAGNPVYDVSFPGVSHDRFGGGGGFGYHFNDHFRADLTLNYLGGDDLFYDDGTTRIDAGYTAWSGLVSAYYDIATVVGITPYVGAGVGLTYSRQRLDAATTTIVGPLAIADTSSSYDFAYALMAGASYKVSDNVSVDLGYQFLHTPDAKYFDADSFTVREGAKHHQVRVGLRYDLW